MQDCFILTSVGKIEKQNQVTARVGKGVELQEVLDTAGGSVNW